MLFTFNPPLLLCSAALLVAASAGALLTALIAPLTRPTPLRRHLWRLLRTLLFLSICAALVGLYTAL